MSDFADFLIGQQHPTVEKRDWMKDKEFILVTPANLDECIDACIESGRYALDLETTGLDNRVVNGRTVDHIAGVCLSPDGVRGYYIPLNHVKVDRTGDRTPRESNVPWSVFDTAFRRLITATENGQTVAVFHNGKFDQEFLQFNGGDPWGEWDTPSTWEDTMILAYLGNSRKRDKRLKSLSKEILGIEQVELVELFPEDYKGPLDFSILDPEDQIVQWYGGGDGICTLLLCDELMPAVTEPASDGKTQKTIYQIEKVCVAATRWMERNRIHIDPDKVIELIRLGQQEWYDSVMDVYQAAHKILGRDVMPGHYKALQDIFVPDDPANFIPSMMDRAKGTAKSKFPDSQEPIVGRAGREWPPVYDIGSAKQLGTMFDEMGVPGLRKTEKTGQVKTTKAELKRVIDQTGNKFPFMEKIQRFREIQKALSNYLYPMCLDSDSTDDTMRINFQGHKVDTGRFSTPSKNVARGRLKGWPQINLQSIPATYDPKRPACMTRLRECITARPTPEGQPPKFIVAIDFSGVELRIITNLSEEPKWMKEFFHCASCDRLFPHGDGQSTPEPPPPRCPNCGSDKIGDLHTLTALEIYGQDAPNKDNWKAIRGYAKACNFALSYGGGGSAVSRATKVDKNEGWRIKKQFDRSYSVLSKWWSTQHNFAREHGFVRTACSRMYPLPDINHDDGGFRAKAERNATNGPIQGCLDYGCRIPTSLGVRPVGELWERQSAGEYDGFDVWTGLDWSRGRALFSGDKELVISTFDSGRIIKTSPEHLFRVWNTGHFEWVHQEDLSLDDWVAINTKTIELPEPLYQWSSTVVPQKGHRFSAGMTPHNAKFFSIDGNSSLLWEFLGLVYGDGSIEQDKIIVHVGESDNFDAEQFVCTYVDKLNSELDVGATVYKKERTSQEAHKRPIWQIKVHNKAFRKFTREVLGVENQNTYTKRFPHAIWSESVTNRAAFLRGYFSADGSVSATGDLVSVRSINLGMLGDAQALLNSIGIRASIRHRSLRVSVLDRLMFRKKVGFLIPHKQERLDRMSVGPYFDQWYRLPPDIIKMVGKEVHSSDIYGGLTKAQKSAVRRLCKGSGSKPQCLRYLAMLPRVPDHLRDLLEYDYEQIVAVERTGEMVPMYDIEVFNEDHAFTCDGAIVHNTSADITKIAMALVYKECKTRDWLDKCAMIITMHDELVFEIDGDILEEAISVILPIMTRNPFIEMLKWPVPLTCDVELGFDWMVPWDLNEMRYGEVRFDGNVKYPEKKKDKLPAGKWETLPSWPPPLVPWFSEAQDGSLPKPPKNSPGGGGETEPPSNPEVIEITTGDDYCYALKRPLSAWMATKLADTIVVCKGHGTQNLRLYTQEGQEIAGWKEQLGLDKVMVNAKEFEILARKGGF